MRVARARRGGEEYGSWENLVRCVGQRFRSTAETGDATGLPRGASVWHLCARWFLRPPVFLQVLMLIVVEVACFQRALEVFISRSLPLAFSLGPCQPAWPLLARRSLLELRQNLVGEDARVVW